MFRKLVTAFVLASSFLALALISQADAAYVGTRRALLTGPCPQQTKVNGTCNSFTADFRSGTYYALGIGYVPLQSWLSTTRASPKMCQFANGTWTSVAANVLCVTDQGALIEEARTNKSTNYNANPPALVAMGTLTAFNAAGVTNVTAVGGDSNTLFGVVNDAAALLAAGLQNIATSGRVFKIDNTAGTATAGIVFNGVTANTNAQTMSAYLRGTAGIYIRDNSNGGQIEPVGTGTYARYVSANYTPANSTRLMQVSVAAGYVGYIILNQLEEGAFVTSPIVTAGASATRAADVAQLIGPAATAALNAKSAFFQTSGVGGGTTPHFLRFDGNAILFFSNSTQVATQNASAQQALTTIGGAGTYSGVVKFAAGFDATSMTAKANNGAQITSANAWAGNTGNAYLGNAAAGTRALNGYMQIFELSNVKGDFDTITMPYLLKRDLNPANDNTPMFLNKAA